MKQTEIGLIPDDWEVKTLGEVAPLQRGFDLPLSEMTNGEYPVVFSNGINAFHNQFKVKAPGVVTGRSGTIGSLHYVEKNYWPHNTTLWVTDFHKNYPKYIFYLFQTINWKSYSGGSGVPTLNRNDVHEQKLLLPPLAEQQRIAKALSDVDALISTTEKLIQKKKNIKQGTMQNLLTGKKRLRGFAKSTNYKQSELGPIPEDWEVKTLSEIFEFKPNNTFTRDCLNDSKGEYQNVHYGDVLIKYSSILDCSKESIPFINEEINVKFSKYGIVEGDIIIADTAEDETVGKVVEIFNLGEKKIVSGLHTFLCRKITDDFAPKWLGYFMNQAIFHNQLLPFITGTKVSAISRTAIQNVKVLIPSKEEQTAIANVLSSMDKEIETLKAKLEKYRNLKTAMMQQLLTGKIRLIK